MTLKDIDKHGVAELMGEEAIFISDLKQHAIKQIKIWREEIEESIEHVFEIEAKIQAFIEWFNLTEKELEQ